MIRFRLPDDEFYKIGWTAYISQGQRRGFYSVGITVMISLAVGVNRSFVLRSLVLRSFIACLPDLITYSLAWTRSCALLITLLWRRGQRPTMIIRVLVWVVN